MIILIFGSQGQLGHHLVQQARQAGHTIESADKPGCDITNEHDVRRAVQASGADVIINCAAYTAVDRAEQEPEQAFAVNADGPAHLARVCSEFGLPVVHVSTDYVFNGQTTRPYLPSDPIRPLGVYGRSKAAGETALAKDLTRHVIVRTSWLFGLQGANFVKTMLKVGKDRAELAVVDDQVGSPTYAADLAGALLKAAVQIGDDRSVWGTYHFCNRGAATWYAFARRIFTIARQYDLFAVREIRPILTRQYPLPAPRPPYSVLDCTSFERTFGMTRRPWEEALEEMIAALYPDEA